MKKKFIYTGLILTIFAFATACSSGSKSGNTTNSEEKKVEITEEPTKEPLPTAEVSITENSDGTSQVGNVTSGYTVSYDSKLLEMKNTENALTFTPVSEKIKDELNLFLTITETDAASAKELGKQLKKSYKGSIKKEKTKLGTSKTPSTYYNITDSKKVTHEVYVISSQEKGWYIELKCPSKYEKKYLSAFEDILGSIDFSATVKE